MPLFKLNESRKETVQLFSFYSEGQRYEGSGYLSWEPSEGFLLEGKAHPANSSRGNVRRQFGQGGPIPTKLFRFTLVGGWRGYSPKVPYSSMDEMRLAFSNEVLIDFSHLILFPKASYPQPDTYGRCIFTIKKNTLLPDPVKHEAMIGKQNLFKRETLSGMLIEDTMLTVIGFVNENGQLELEWQSKNSFLSRGDERRMGLVIRDALSICLGQVVHAHQIELFRNNKFIIEYMKLRQAVSLGFLAPVWDEAFEKELFVRLLKLLIKNDAKAVIVKNLFYRVADAMNTRNSDMWTFMISSALEAVVRTYYNHTSRNWLDRLEEFRQSFFGDRFANDWVSIFDKAIKCYKKYRHRKAHPHWLDRQPEPHSKSQEEFEDLVFLSQLYGYVILALVGYKNLEPRGHLKLV